MKRLIALLLVSCVLFLLCASAFADTKDVEALMLVANEDEESMKNAWEAFNALTDEEKSQISKEAKDSLYKARLFYYSYKDVEVLMLAANEDEESIKIALDAFNVLTDEEKSKISEEAKESLYKARLYNLANKVASLGNAALFVTDAFVTAWENVGTDKVTDYVGYTKFFTNPDLTVSEYAEFISLATGKRTSEEDVSMVLWHIARALYPDGVNKTKSGIPIPNEWVSDQKKQDTIAISGQYNKKLNFIKTNKDVFPEEVRLFRSEYKTQYPDEVSTLNDMLIETNLFVNLALNPKGNLVSYKKEVDDYRNKVDRFLITMDAYY